VTALGDREFAQLVFDDRIDILVDLGGHTGSSRLEAFGYKPAPVQVTWLGYPDTTGLPEVDYRFTDILADPPGAEAFHTEQLVRLPACFLCYAPRHPCPAPSPPPALTTGRVTFGSFNNLAKLSPQTLRAWAAILQSVPTAHLFIKGKALRDPLSHEQFRQKLIAHGIDITRTELQGWTTSSEDHMELYGHVDIALDTFPYNGTTTTCEALWMGVPVVTLTGETHAGRVGTSLLSAVGLNELVAGTETAYIELATRLAGDPQQLAHRRADLRDRMASSPLCDGPRFAREVEDAYRAMWRRWCRNKA
jgi:predicted O-linked N-acetylglucosamine transferase (SPINDLY family)